MEKKYIDRIFDRIEIDPVTRCWNWTGCLINSGYAQISTNNKDILVHRIMYQYIHGNIPTDKPLILHRCDNRKCCNPLHLYAGTHQNNTDDRIKRNPAAWIPGSKGKISELTDQHILEIRSAKESNRILSERYNVNLIIIHYIQTGQIYKHIK